MLNGLDLFSGIGGISYALRDYVKPIAYCEIDPYCQSVLLQRMSEGNLSKAPIWDDVRTLPSQDLPEVDIIYGGFPCQDISIAGHGKGLEGKRSRLFFEIVRLAKEIKPSFIFLENVPAIRSRGGITVLREITQLGYDSRFCVISAASCGALHRRQRWFLLARSQHNEDVADSASFASQQKNSESMSKRFERKTWNWNTRGCGAFESREHWKEAVSRICRTSDGVPFQMERLRSLGNAVVPCQAREAFEILIGVK